MQTSHCHELGDYGIPFMGEGLGSTIKRVCDRVSVWVCECVSVWVCECEYECVSVWLCGCVSADVTVCKEVEVKQYKT